MLNVEEFKSSVKLNDILADALVKKFEEEEISFRKRKRRHSSSGSDDSDGDDKSSKKKHKKKKKKHKKHKKKKSSKESKSKQKSKTVEAPTTTGKIQSSSETASKDEKRGSSTLYQPLDKIANSESDKQSSADASENGQKLEAVTEESKTQEAIVTAEADEESCEEGQIKDSEDEKEEVKDPSPEDKHTHKKHKHKKRKRTSSKEHKHHDSDTEHHSRHHRDYVSVSPVHHHHHRRHSYFEKYNKITEKHQDRSRSPHVDQEIRERINKEELRRIARRNLLEMIETGNLPKGVNMDMIKREWIEDLKAEKRDVNEWTEFCRALSKMEEEEGDDDEDTIRHKLRRDSDEEGDTPFIHHPFKLREPQPIIRLNIKNAVQIPVKTPAEKVANAAKLRLQFPVSSGNQHRMKEFEWVPVKEEESPTKKSVVKSEVSVPFKPKPSSPVETKEITLQPFYLPNAVQKAEMGLPLLSYPHLPVETTTPVMPSPPEPSEPSESCPADWDISTIMAQRVHAMRLLQEDPTNLEAQQQAQESQRRMQEWVQSKQQPGMFTGTTNAKILSPEELCGPIPAWTKKDQFSRAHPVGEGIGMHLLKKMGWNPGEGLGKNKEGALEPLLPDIKTDKRGLVSGEDMTKKIIHIVPKNTSGKHPVSALTELCTKRKWGPPEFHLLNESGPDHRKSFLFKVRVNGVEYQPGVSSTTKKQAKAHAAQVCLQALGVPT